MDLDHDKPTYRTFELQAPALNSPFCSSPPSNPCTHSQRAFYTLPILLFHVNFRPHPAHISTLPSFFSNRFALHAPLLLVDSTPPPQISGWLPPLPPTSGRQFGAPERVCVWTAEYGFPRKRRRVAEEMIGECVSGPLKGVVFIYILKNKMEKEARYAFGDES